MIVFREFKLTGTLVPSGQLSTEFQLVNHTLDSENVPSKEARGKSKARVRSPFAQEGKTKMTSFAALVLKTVS